MVVDCGPSPPRHAEYDTAPSDRRHWIVLACLILLVLVARLPTYSEPLERDITTYAVIGHELLGGRTLYSDLWDNKPPLVPLTYAAAEVAAGYGANAILFLGVGAASLTLLGVYRAVSLATGDTAAGLWGAAFWAAISADQTLQANQPNVEAFVNVCLVWSVVLVLRLGSATASYEWPALLGLLAALASLYKPVALPVLALLGCAHLAVPAGAATSRVAAFRDLAIATSAFAAVWSCVVGYFVATGRGDTFYWSVITYNQEFAGGVVANFLKGFAPARLFPRWFWFAFPLALLSVLAVLSVMRRGPVRFAMIWLAYACGTAVAVALPGLFWPHYYQLWLPVLAIGGGAAVACINEVVPHLAPWAGRVAAGIALGVLVAHELPFYAQSPDEWSLNKYGSIFIETRELAHTLNTLLVPGETFFEWGSETGLYYVSRRSPPSGVFYIYPVIVPSSFVPRFTTRVITDLERTKPELLVVCKDYVYPRMPTHALAQWLDRRYRVWATAPIPERFRLYVRSGGPLQARLRQQGRL